MTRFAVIPEKIGNFVKESICRDMYSTFDTYKSAVTQAEALAVTYSCSFIVVKYFSIHTCVVESSLFE